MKTEFRITQSALRTVGAAALCSFAFFNAHANLWQPAHFGTNSDITIDLDTKPMTLRLDVKTSGDLSTISTDSSTPLFTTSWDSKSYYWSDFQYVEITGELNDDDLKAVNNLPLKNIGLYNSTYNGDKADYLTALLAKDEISFSTVNTIALPNLGINEDVSAKMLSAHSNLKAVGYYEGPNFYLSQSEAGHMKDVTYSFPDRVTINGLLSNATSLTVSGSFNAKDLVMNRKVDENGHLVLATTQYNQGGGLYPYSGTNTNETPETKSDYLAHPFSKLTKLDLSKATLGLLADQSDKETAQNDLCIAAYGFNTGYLATVELPRDPNFYRLPANALSLNSSSYHAQCLPDNIKEIGNGVFDRTFSYLKVIYTETTAREDSEMFGIKKDDKVYMIDGVPFTAEELASIDFTKSVEKPVYENSTLKGYMVDGIFYTEAELAAAKANPSTSNLASDECSITLPPNLTRIGRGAFWTMKPYDVYVLNTGDVPYCASWAFNPSTYFGNNGYQLTDPLTKNSFHNGDNVFGQLHIPAGLSDDKKKLYMDDTRQFTFADETNMTDADGNPIFWPNQADWNRSYEQASTGYTWTQWANSTDRSGTAPLLFAENGLQDEAFNSTTLQSKVTPDQLTEANTFAPWSDDETRGLKEYDTWIGWHQFVLSYTYNIKDPAHDNHQTKISDDNWWSTYLPFDMTKDQIEHYFGTGTQVVTLTSVARYAADGGSFSNNGENYTDIEKGTIVLGFCHNLMEKDLEDNTVKGSDVVIRDQHPYLIKPTKSSAELGGGPLITLDLGSHKSSIATDPQPVHDKTLRLVTSKKWNGSTMVDDIPYLFIGSLTTDYLPDYCYYLGWNAAAGEVAYYWHHPDADNNKKTVKWGNYTSIVAPVQNGVSDVKWNGTVNNNTSRRQHWEITSVVSYSY